MTRSSVKRLPAEVRGPLEEWLKEFLAEEISLDQVVERLEGLVAFHGLDPEIVPSRSAVHRYSKSFDKVVQRLQRSAELTKLMSDELGPAVADGQGVQLMVRLLQGLTYDLFASIEDGTPIDPKTIHDLAKATHHLAAAQKTDADRAMKIEAEVRKKAAADVKEACTERGLPEDVAEALFQRVLKLEK